MSYGTWSLRDEDIDGYDIIMWCDGSSFDVGPGGWATLILDTEQGGEPSIYSGYSLHTSPDVMEFYAIYQGLLLVDRKDIKILIYSDCESIIDLLVGRSISKNHSVRVKINVIERVIKQKGWTVHIEQIKSGASDAYHRKADREAYRQALVAQYHLNGGPSTQ